MELFKGENKSGNLQEALQDAIKKAKEGLITDYVHWKLESITGNDGGIAMVQDIVITISAQAGK